MSEHDEDRQPFWTVFMIFDPDGSGGDFSYTVGLAERGLPELHMWARPSLGSDPGDDWKFSQNDTAHILNGLARRLVDGNLHVGDTWSEKYDAGLVSVHFRLDPAEPAEALEALEAGDVPVLPVRWSLEREPVGQSRPLNDAAMAEAVKEYAAFYSLFGRSRPIPSGWRLVPGPDWSPEGRFGPRTPLVIARAHLVLAADGPAMVGIVSFLAAVRGFGSLSHPAALANAVARPLGRVAAMAEIAHEAHRLGDEFAVTWGAEAAEEVLEWMEVTDPDEREEELDHVRRLLGEALHSFLAVEAVRDGDASLMVPGHGPVMLGYLGNGVPPTKDWVAAVSVTELLLPIAAERSPQELVAAALAWKQAERELPGDLLMKVDALAATTASMAPHPNDWIPSTAIDEIHTRLQAEGFSLVLLQEWGNAFCVLLTHRGRFTSEEVAVFAATSATGVTGLGELLNEPLLDAG